MDKMLVRIVAGVLLLTARMAIAAPDCESISGFDEYVLHARGVVVGDMHGTVQAPAFTAALVCNLAHAGREIVLGLEYPTKEQHFLEEFLQADTDAPQPGLLSTPFWARSIQDGRSSRAMLDLLSSVRQQIRSGARIRVAAFDAEPKRAVGGGARFDARDEAMAAYLRHELFPLRVDEIPVIFAGNVHARKTKGLHALNAPPSMENAEPLGYRLRDLGFLHMNIDYRGGTAWICRAPSNCGVQDVGAPGTDVSSFSIVPSRDPAYDFQYFVGTLTASLPAATAK